MNPWANAFAADMIDRSAFKWPQRTSISDGTMRVSYQELRDGRNSLAGSLLDLGLGEGDRVATYLGESWQHIVALYALLFLGVEVVPLNLTWTRREILFALEQADVNWIICGTEYRGTDLRERIAECGIHATGELADSRFPHLKGMLGLDSTGVVNGRWWINSMLDTASATPPRGTNQSGFILFTSGSTAFPKGAVIRQDAALGTSFYVTERLGVDENDRYLNTLPLYHGGGLLAAMFGCHQRGAAFHIFQGMDQELMLDVLEREQCTTMLGFDLVNMRLIRGLQERGRPVPITKMQISPGINTFEELTSLGIKVALCYALTESSNFVSLTDPNRDDPSKQLSNGRPFPGVEVRIVDYETGEQVDPGTPGEICFRGWNQMVGYYRNAEKTRQAFDTDGFIHTGDYGWLDEDGYVYYRGRYAMMVKTGGENVSELEVENFLTVECTDVVNAAVVGVPDEKWGEAVVAFVETVDQFDPAKLSDECRDKLAPFKVPKHFFEVKSGEWPVTPTGKMIKSELREAAERLVIDARTEQASARGSAEESGNP